MTSWYDAAACRGRDQRLWFPHRGDLFARAVAKTVCASCPVRAECLGAALSADFPVAGIWGGLTEHERDVIAGARHAG